VDLLAFLDMDLTCKVNNKRSNSHLGYFMRMYFPFIVLSFRRRLKVRMSLLHDVTAFLGIFLSCDSRK
jgi:hypothetical protein